MIRPARNADAPAIAAIWNPIIRDTVVTFTPVEKSEADIITLLATRAGEGHPFLVAEADGDVLGFATYSQFRSGPGYARTMEHSVNLSRRARGRGLGRALMEALEREARAKGIHVLIGAISATNTDSLRFHEKAGFAQSGRLRAVGWKFGRFHDLILMQKQL